MIRTGALPGRKIAGRWFVAPPLVRLEYPNTEDPTTGLLRISACKLGSWVTAGRGELGIPLSVDDPGRAAALQHLNAAIRKRAPGLPVAVHLSGEGYLFDSSLWVDLGAALVEFDVLMGADPRSDSLGWSE